MRSFIEFGKRQLLDDRLKLICIDKFYLAILPEFYKKTAQNACKFQVLHLLFVGELVEGRVRKRFLNFAQQSHTPCRFLGNILDSLIKIGPGDKWALHFSFKEDFEYAPFPETERGIQ